MSQRYGDDGKVVPVTVVKAEPCTVIGTRTKEKDGYEALQVACGGAKKVRKSVLGQVKGLKVSPRTIREFRVNRTDVDTDISQVNAGATLVAAAFQPGDRVKVTGKSKGKGFQGVVRRHGFHGSPASHGHKDQLRMPGSIGSTDAARVFKGKKMPGRMGGDRVSIINMTVVDVDEKESLIFLKGAVPGHRGSIVYLEAEGEMAIQGNEKPEKEKPKEEAKPEEAVAPAK